MRDNNVENIEYADMDCSTCAYHTELGYCIVSGDNKHEGDLCDNYEKQ